ncbi:MAG: ParA family protein [Gammaproteobacteria bacterium]
MSLKKLVGITYKLPVLAVLNQKGGVGKTTVSSILAEYAAIKMGIRVLIVDLDMQCNSSDYWIGMEPAPNATGGQLPPRHPEYDGDPNIEERSSIADTFYGKGMLPHETYLKAANGFSGSVEILLGHPERLERINSEYDNASGRIDTEVIHRIGNVLHQDEMVESYDLIILDTGPSRNPVFRSALRAATHALIPFEPEEKSLQGINAMLQAMASENFTRHHEDDLILVGLLPNKVRSQTNIHTGTLNILREELPGILCPEDVFLPQSTAFPERDVKGVRPKSIFQISPSHRARKQSERVGEFVLNRVMIDERFSIKKETTA